MASRTYVALVLALALLAVSCSSASGGGDESSGGEGATEVIADETGGEDEADDDGQPAVDLGGSSGVDPDFDYTTVDYDAESVGNALFGDRARAEFPPPLVPLEDIRGGGPPPDGIPAIDFPQFLALEDVVFMESEQEPIIAVTVDGTTKGYPIRVMTWHEIVNDTFVGQSGEETAVTITYCPLCNSAIAYNRQLGSRLLDFGTSGELYQSAMVMYDRQTQSLWSHFLGQGIVGHYAGAQLELIPAQTLSWESFKEAYPDAVVLNPEETGHDRPYGANPYTGYDDENGTPFPGFVTQPVDSRLPSKARILGVRDADNTVAIPFASLTETGVVQLGPTGWDVVAFLQPGLSSALETSTVFDGRDVGQTGAFQSVAADGTPLTFVRTDDGFVDDQTGTTWSITGRAVAGPLTGEQLTPVNSIDTFWFAWYIYQPDTAVHES